MNHRLASVRTLLFCCVLVPFLSGCFPAVAVGTLTGVSMIHDRRTPGTVIDDQGIEIKALSEIAKEDFYKDSHLSIVSYNERVLLVGQVPTLKAKRKAERLVRAIGSVEKVYNELSVTPPIALTTRAKDSWITTKVKARFVANKQIDPLRIKVITENGTVFLMGIVSQDEAQLATQETQEVSGVRNITRVFEYAKIEHS